MWDGDADLVEFIKQAQEEDLYVLLRPGPYICAEREFVRYYHKIFITEKYYTINSYTGFKNYKN